MKSKLDEATLEALRVFARENGRRWKAALREVWFLSRESDYPSACELRRARNVLGPSGLEGLKLDGVR